MLRLVLSIDGGGIRGVIPARILSQVEHMAGKPCAEIFDLIAGTSTGGIIACGLGVDLPAVRMFEMYATRGPEIFSRPWWRRGLGMSKYPATGIEKVLTDVFGDHKFGDSKTKLMVTALDQQQDVPAHFKSWESDSQLTYLRDVARATSAAPTYFPSSQGRYSDGGIFATDPAMNAFAESRVLWPGDPLLMLSLGTGFRREAEKYPSNGGLVQWAEPLIHALLESPGEDVAYMAKACMGSSYLRIQGSLPADCNSAMDDASTSNIAALGRFADVLLSQNLAVIKGVIQ